MGIEQDFENIKFKDLELYRPYQVEGADAPSEESNSYVMFLDRSYNTKVLEHNELISTVSIHRWEMFHDKNKDIEERSYDLRKFNDFRYVIRSLFEATNFMKDK